MIAVPSRAETGPKSGSTSERGFSGYLVRHGDVELAAEHADRLMTPASLLKIVVATAALHHLGPEHRIATRLRTSGTPRQGTLTQDLWLEAAGDPTWSRRFFDDPQAPLRALARQLRRRGIDTVDGDLVLSTVHFAGRRAPPSRALDEFPYAWAAPTSPLAVDDNRWRLEIAPGPRVGSPASVRRLDDHLPSIPLINQMTTVAAARHGRGTVDVRPDWQGRDLLLRGEYPVSEPSYVIEVSHPQPSMGALQAVRGALQAEGVRLLGKLRQTTEAPPTEAQTVAQIESPPLRERLPSILTESRNWHAEMLLLHLAFEVEGIARRDTGLDVERRFLIDSVGLDASSFVLDDASGISPYNLITPQALSDILEFAWRQPWRRHFVDALAGPGQGTLGAWRGLPPVAAKTGTLRHCVGLAGYLEPPSANAAGEQPTLFVHIIQHDPSARPELRSRIAGHLATVHGRGTRRSSHIH